MTQMICREVKVLRRLRYVRLNCMFLDSGDRT